MTAKRKRETSSVGGDDLRTGKRPKASADAEACQSLSSQAEGGSGTFTKLPEELNREILRYFPSIEDTTYIHEQLPSATRTPRRRQRGSGVHSTGARSLPVAYLDRGDTLRSLRATCTAFNAIFEPLLWETLDICFPSRRAGSNEENGGLVDEQAEPVHKTIGEAMLRKAQGLLQNPELAVMVRSVNVIFTRYNMDVALPAFARCLRLMPNLRTIRVLDANPQMPNIVKKAFTDDSPLLGVRTLIIPAVCHELLKRCPNVERVWCNQGVGNKLLTVIRGFCKQVVEIKGFRCEENTESMKRLVKELPNLEFLELNAPLVTDTVALLAELKQLRRVDVRIPGGGQELEDAAIQRTIREVKAIIHALSKTKERQLRFITRSPEGSDIILPSTDTAIDVDMCSD